MKLRVAKEEPTARPRSVNVEKVPLIVLCELFERRGSVRVTLNRGSEQAPRDSMLVGNGGNRQVWVMAQIERRADLIRQPAGRDEYGLGPQDELTTVKAGLIHSPEGSAKAPVKSRAKRRPLRVSER
jgi:hypothetical protein